MGREENVLIFEDTIKLCVEHEKIRTCTEESINYQKLIEEEAVLRTNRSEIYEEQVKVIVSKKRSFEAAREYRGYKTCVHNFASATNPGGGVERGANAQEECLCRCSNLFPCLKARNVWNGFYASHRNSHNPLHNDDIIYTPDVLVFKSDTSSPKLLPEQEWYDVNVITCAAPNLRERPNNKYNSGDGNTPIKISDTELKELHVKRLRRILDVALMSGNEVVILGAFGCGAFANNAEVVASAAREVIEDYCYSFKVIEFAVYCSPRDEENYNVFKRVLDSPKKNGN